MAVRFSLKWWLHLLGGGLGLVGVIFVALRLSTNVRQINFARFDFVVGFILALLTFVYGAGNLLLARAWWHLLNFLEVKTSWRWAIKVYGQSQLAKYVPGNIFHLAGRQTLGMAAGLPARPLAKSSLWELGLLAAAGAILGILALPLLWPTLALWMSTALFMAVMLILCAASYSLYASRVTWALMLQTAFLALSGCVFIGILTVVVPESTALPALPVLCGAYVLAWLAGFITPGTPAGVGVREIVLLFLLRGQIEQADLLLAIVLGRVVTVIGDLLYFIMATFINKKRRIKE